jgi:phosphonate transport system ATP-binding protein
MSSVQKYRVLLKIEQLSKTFSNGVNALKSVSFEVGQDDFIVVLGMSGSGKSTLLRCLNRLVEPTSGKIVFEEQDISQFSPKLLRQARRKIGFVFQDYNLVNRSSVISNVLAGRLGYSNSLASLINYFSKEDKHRALESLERVDIAEKAYGRADTLSGGQRQRVGVARALMQEPVLILADEPVSSLDPSLARSILGILKKINENDKTAIICNLHQPELAKEFANRILVLKEGNLVFDGTPDELGEAFNETIYKN